MVVEEVGQSLVDEQDKSGKHQLDSISVDYTAPAVGELKVEVNTKHSSNPLIQEARIIIKETGKVASKAVMRWSEAS